MYSKEYLRNMMKKCRKSYPENLRMENSKKISEILFAAEQFNNAECVCLYMSSFGEVSTKAIMEECIKSGKRIAVPVTDTATNTLTLSYTGEVFKKGEYGISEPGEYRVCGFNEPDIIIVPGICFDRSGGRIGFGKGYYDRFLAKARGYRIGLCYEFQLVDEIPADEHDIKMNAVISEKGYYGI